MEKNILYIYTDGACCGNPGPGGWCSILSFNGTEKVLCGGEADTTNNRMELTAVIEGLKALNRRCRVVITTDSKYVADAVTKGWLFSWQKRGWKKADGKPVFNVELWQELFHLLPTQDIEFIWIKGHNGHQFNERCDKIAVEQSHLYSKNV